MTELPSGNAHEKVANRDESLSKCHAAWARYSLPRLLRFVTRSCRRATFTTELEPNSYFGDSFPRLRRRFARLNLPTTGKKTTMSPHKNGKTEKEIRN